MFVVADVSFCTSCCLQEVGMVQAWLLHWFDSAPAAAQIAVFYDCTMRSPSCSLHCSRELLELLEPPYRPPKCSHVLVHTVSGPHALASRHIPRYRSDHTYPDPARPCLVTHAAQQCKGISRERHAMHSASTASYEHRSGSRVDQSFEKV
jgi:hypothetical protein